MNTAQRSGRICLITSCGLGYLRPAPGTWGSLPPVVLGLGLILIARATADVNPDTRAGLGELPAWTWPAWYALMAVLAVVFSAACVLGGDEAEALWGKKDPGHIVADETAGMALTLGLAPAPYIAVAPPMSIVPALMLLAGAFVAFRLADIVKLWPAGRLQAVRGGWGILLDDLVAGVQAAVLVWVGWMLWTGSLGSLLATQA